MSPVALRYRTQPAEVDGSPKYFPVKEWTPLLAEGLRLPAQYEQRDVMPVRYCAFEVPNLDLTLASDRWVVRWPGHPELTFDDLRSGRLPKPTPEELAQRKQAIEDAQKIRSNLDIRPLTTGLLIRKIRGGDDQD